MPLTICSALKVPVAHPLPNCKVDLGDSTAAEVLVGCADTSVQDENAHASTLKATPAGAHTVQSPASRLHIELWDHGHWLVGFDELHQAVCGLDQGLELCFGCLDSNEWDAALVRITIPSAALLVRLANFCNLGIGGARLHHHKPLLLNLTLHQGLTAICRKVVRNRHTADEFGGLRAAGRALLLRNAGTRDTACNHSQGSQAT